MTVPTRCRGPIFPAAGRPRGRRGAGHVRSPCGVSVPIRSERVRRATSLPMTPARSARRQEGDMGVGWGAAALVAGMAIVVVLGLVLVSLAGRPGPVWLPTRGGAARPGRRRRHRVAGLRPGDVRRARRHGDLSLADHRQQAEGRVRRGLPGRRRSSAAGWSSRRSAWSVPLPWSAWSPRACAVVTRTTCRGADADASARRGATSRREPRRRADQHRETRSARPTSPRSPARPRSAQRPQSTAAPYTSSSAPTGSNADRSTSSSNSATASVGGLAHVGDRHQAHRRRDVGVELEGAAHRDRADRGDAEEVGAARARPSSASTV